MITVGLYLYEIARWRVNHPNFEKKDTKMEFVISLCTDESILIDLAESDIDGTFCGLTTAEEMFKKRVQAKDILCSEIVKVKPSMVSLSK